MCVFFINKLPRCFPVNIMKFLRTPFLQKNLRKTPAFLFKLFSIHLLIFWHISYLVQKNVPKAISLFGISHRGCSIKKVFLTFLNIQRKTPALVSIFNKVAGLQPYQKETPTQVFSCEYCKVF